ncbi:thioredoxin family protein [Brachyspira hyodysenteriae]|uniref:thioredoxin family protein n=1 Tax=Brachyspira hyodysenteriae TaxID=159 RepID=UPI001182544B|nr:thioredoxin family protein [Brachyspira hyodysenteriae]TVL66819.1 redox-active disulfide protein 2 [Brachyspira hyodysenteriae]TVL75018.1 redox-active disulfide protein 2 [Brachyspira hyodysenteriae]
MFFNNNKKSQCSCGGLCSYTSEENARIKILGTGCLNCKKLEENTLKALKDMGVNLTVGHVYDIEKIAAYGVISTPSLVLDENVLSYGKVLNKDEIIELLKDKL